MSPLPWSIPMSSSGHFWFEEPAGQLQHWAWALCAFQGLVELSSPDFVLLLAADPGLKPLKPLAAACCCMLLPWLFGVWLMLVPWCQRILSPWSPQKKNTLFDMIPKDHCLTSLQGGLVVDLRNSIGGCLTFSNPDMVAGFNPAVFSWLLGKGLCGDMVHSWTLISCR